MSDLISRQAAYDTLTEYYHHKTETQHESLKEALSRVPTIDAVPVVRCKDCVHHKDAPKTTDVWCERVDGLLPKDWFCADGKRG